MIRGLTIATGVLAAAYCGYWFVAAHTARGVADRVVADLRDSGLTVDTTVAVRGFPSRIDTTFGDVAVTDPDTGIIWQAPWVRVFALSYMPNRIIAALPPEQTLTLPGDVLTLASDRIMASARVALSTDLALENLTAEGDALALTAASGWTGGAAHVLAALRRVDDATYDLFAEVTDITLPDPVIAVLDPARTLPATLPILRVDAQAVLDAPIAHDSAPAITALTLRDMRADWGDTGLTLTGQIAPDANGLATGTLELTLRNWPRLIDVAVNAGLIPPDQAGLWTGALQAAAMGDVSLTAPITLANGRMSIGPLPLGPAPRLTYSQ